MSATAGGRGGGKGDKEAEGEGESRGVVDMTEEVAFTPPDGGLRVSKLGLTFTEFPVFISAIDQPPIIARSYCRTIMQSASCEIDSNRDI